MKEGSSGFSPARERPRNVWIFFYLKGVMEKQLTEQKAEAIKQD